MIQLLKDYINKIDDQLVKSAVIKMMECAPRYYWSTPASSTGKYHPSYATGPDGLQKHTVAGMHFVIELSRTYRLNQLEIDLCLAAMVLHDTTKYGVKDEMDYSYFNVHPYTVRSYYDNPKERPTLKHCIEGLKQRELWNTIMKCVECHMGSIDNGEWNPMGLKPENKLETIVHLSDFLASRKEISLNIFQTNER